MGLTSGRDAVGVFYSPNCGVMVIGVVNGDRRHEFNNLEEAVCISHSSNIFGKDMNRIILPPAIGNYKAR